jgi:hypothetical protein
MKKRRVTVTLDRFELRKLDRIVGRMWPSLKPAKKHRAAGLLVLLRYADGRSGSYDVRFRARCGL